MVTRARIKMAVCNKIYKIHKYAAETRTDTAKTMQILEVTEMKTLRRITNKTRMDKMRNERIGKHVGSKK